MMRFGKSLGTLDREVSEIKLMNDADPRDMEAILNKSSDAKNAVLRLFGLEKGKNKNKKKCWACNGKGYHMRIVTGNVAFIKEKCYSCDGTGIYDPDRVKTPPVMILK